MKLEKEQQFELKAKHKQIRIKAETEIQNRKTWLFEKIF